jgi:hypothetical protein
LLPIVTYLLIELFSLMKKGIYILLFFWTMFGLQAQHNSQWKGYFSYSNVSCLSAGNTTFFAAADNAVFSKNIISNELLTLNTVDGLSGLPISAFYFHQNTNRLFLGFSNGFMQVRNQADGSIRSVVDIINKQGIPPNIKKINQFSAFENNLYLATDFGIVVYNLNTQQFGDTYIMGPGGTQIAVLNIVVHQGFIYALTASQGILRASLSNPNLIDYNQWTVFDPGTWRHLVNFNGFLVATNSDTNLYVSSGGFFTPILNLNGQLSLSLSANSEFLVATTANTVFVVNTQFGTTAQINRTQLPIQTTAFTSGLVVQNNLYIGTQDKGVFELPIGNTTNLSMLLPDGPIKNDIFYVKNSPSGNQMWVVYGRYTPTYNPFPLDAEGISRYTPEGWLNIPFEDLPNVRNLVKVTFNPNNEDEMYVSAYYSGLLKFENAQFTTLYDSNTPNGPEDINNPASPNDIRINGTAFDRMGNLWSVNSFVANALKVKRTNNQWQSFSIQNFVNNPQNLNVANIVVDRNNTKWFGTDKDGLLGFNENANPQFKKVLDGNGNETDALRDVRVVALDNRNQLWIGTRSGLRVFPGIDRFLSDNNLTHNPIIISENGIAQELLADQYITAIAVDGANNKWIGTADAGTFLVSSNGQQTLQRFTAENSPLPSNGILAIDINDATGEVFFVTDRGMVSYRGTATGGADNFNNVVVYPNPVRPNYEGNVKISGLVDRANVKVTDIEGNLVFEAYAEGGTLEWDTTAFGKYKVASGVYMIFMTTNDGMETKVKKVMIIR